MIELKNINKSFGSKQVLKNISCLIEKGDFIVIVGTNGSGKTTFFDIISGKTIADTGKILYNNHPITHDDESKRGNLIGRLFQDVNLSCVASMTVMENFALSLLKQKTASFNFGITREKYTTVLTVLQQFNLDHLINVKMGSLSGGQRQLLAFIMATLTNPQLLLLDEPTAALDPKAATVLLQEVVMYNKKKNLTTLLITHDPLIAMALGNKIWVLDNGVITKTLRNQPKENTIVSQDLIGHIDYTLLQNLSV